MWLKHSATRRNKTLAELRMYRQIERTAESRIRPPAWDHKLEAITAKLGALKVRSSAPPATLRPSVLLGRAPLSHTACASTRRTHTHTRAI